MANVLEKSPDVSDGFQTLAKRLQSMDPSNAKGALYELTVASKLIDDGFEGAQVVKVRMIAKLVKTTEGGTDLDVVLELANGKRVIVQAKATDQSGGAAIDAARIWVGKARSLATKEGWSNYQIVYAVPSTHTVSEAVATALQSPTGLNVMLVRDIDLAFPH